MTLEIYPTLRCNLDCRFCDTTDRHRPAMAELSSARWLEIIDEAADMGAEQLFVLGGGEPMIRRDILEIMSRAKERQMRGMLTTNGTFFNAQKSKRLIEMQWDEIHFSIDGATADVHDDLRGQKGTFVKACRAACQIATFKRRLGVNSPMTAIHFVLTERNWRQLSDMVRLCRALGASRLDVDSLIAYMPEQKKLELTPNSIKGLPHEAAKAKGLADKWGIAHTLDQFLSVNPRQRGVNPPTAPKEKGLKGAPCLKAWHHLVIQADGKSSPCCVLSGSGGSAKETDLKNIWTKDPFLLTVREGMKRGKPLDRCKECSWNILRHEAEIRDELGATT